MAAATTKKSVVCTFGTFDLLHIGHVNIILRAAELGDKLVVGVSSDQLNLKKKGKYPVYTEVDRMEIVRALKGVDEVFLEESLEQKREYLVKHKADILVMGDDWKGRFDEFNDICQVTYLPRTNGISTTSTVEKVQSTDKST